MEWLEDLQSYEYDQSDVESLTTPWNRGENHPLYGTTQDEDRKAKHSQDCKDWWAQHTPEERKKIAGKNKGKFWITNGTDNKMITGDIPEGWSKGRTCILSEEGKKNIIAANKRKKEIRSN